MVKIYAEKKIIFHRPHFLKGTFTLHLHFHNRRDDIQSSRLIKRRPHEPPFTKCEIRKKMELPIMLLLYTHRVICPLIRPTKLMQIPYKYGRKRWHPVYTQTRTQSKLIPWWNFILSLFSVHLALQFSDRAKNIRIFFMKQRLIIIYRYSKWKKKKKNYILRATIIYHRLSPRTIGQRNYNFHRNLVVNCNVYKFRESRKKIFYSCHT